MRSRLTGFNIYFIGRCHGIVLGCPARLGRSVILTEILQRLSKTCSTRTAPSARLMTDFGSVPDQMAVRDLPGSFIKVFNKLVMRHILTKDIYFAP